jgi:hypothetical protein
MAYLLFHIKQMFQTFLLLCVSFFAFLFVCCFLLDDTTPCLTLLLLLLLFVQCYCSFCYPLLNVPCLTPLLFAWRPCSSCSSCCTFHNVVAPLIISYSTLLFLSFFFAWWCCPLLDIATPLATPFIVVYSMLIVVLLLLVWHYCSSTAPCSTLLLLLLLFGQHYYSSYCSLVKIVFEHSLVNVHLRHDLFKYLSAMLWCCCSYVPYSWQYSHSSCFRLVFPPLIFYRCEKNSPNSNFQAKLKRWDFFSIFVCWWNFLWSMLFFGNFGWQCVCLLCAKIIWTLYV